MIFKRGFVGTYQHMSEERLHRYLAEFDMRYSTETNTDTERAAAIVAGMVSCHLAYRRIDRFAA